MVAADIQQLHARALQALNARNLGEAERLFRHLLKQQPDHVPALNLLTIVLMSTGRFREAEAPIARAVALNQSSDVSFYNYGSILKQIGKPREALEQFGKALALNGKVPETWNNRGTVHNDLKEYDAALADFDKALALNANFAEAHCNRGRALSELRRRSEAMQAFDRAVALRPELAEAWIGRGAILSDLKDFAGALVCYERAVRTRPDLPQSWLGQANVLGFLGRFEEALTAYEKALAMKPDLADGWLARGNLLSSLKRYGEAVACFDKAYAIDPDLPELAGNRFFCKMQLCDWRGFEADRSHLLASMAENRPVVSPFIALCIAEDPQAQLDYARCWWRLNFEGSSLPRAREVRQAGKIRVGYLSGDLRQHPVSYLMAGVFEAHDRERFETIAISVGLDEATPIRARLKRAFDRFIDAYAKPDVEIIKLIDELDIDILVDLMGFTEAARGRVLAARPAPLIVNYLGYAGTLGAGCVDYIVVDKTIAPASHRKFYQEKVAYLPRCYMPSDDVGRRVSDRRFSREELGLPRDGFVFCCFNNAYKINPPVFQSWMRIMRAVDDSVLWLSAMNETAKSNLRAEAAAAGIDPQRIVFANYVGSPEEHLARHAAADLFIDTFPYNAHTTASDALLAGLPVLTRAGETFASRVAASLLSDLGLTELIAASPAEYEALAIALGRDRTRLDGLRTRLREGAARSRLFDTHAFTRDLEALYQAMYDRHRAGMSPDHIEIEHSQ